MSLISFEDAVTASNLNPSARYGVYYADGEYANYNAVRARLPDAKLYGITVRGLAGAHIFACDSESGDLTVAETINWVGEQVKLNVGLVVVYANLSRWLDEGLLTALAHHGHRIKRWVAHYNGIAEIPSWADADQFATGNVDRNVALANFFDPYQPPPPPDPHHYLFFDTTNRLVSGDARIKRHANERETVKEYDVKRQHPKLYPHRLARLRSNLSVLAARLTELAKDDPKHKTDWHRQWRHDQLEGRAADRRYV